MQQGNVFVCTHCGKTALRGMVRQIWYGNMQVVLRYHDVCFNKLRPMDASLFRSYDYAIPVCKKDDGGVATK
jgi:hypothetical protein